MIVFNCKVIEQLYWYKYICQYSLFKAIIYEQFSAKLSLAPLQEVNQLCHDVIILSDNMFYIWGDTFYGSLVLANFILFLLLNRPYLFFCKVCLSVLYIQLAMELLIGSSILLGDSKSISNWLSLISCTILCSSKTPPKTFNNLEKIFSYIRYLIVTRYTEENCTDYSLNNISTHFINIACAYVLSAYLIIWLLISRYDLCYLN